MFLMLGGIILALEMQTRWSITVRMVIVINRDVNNYKSITVSGSNKNT